MPAESKLLEYLIWRRGRTLTRATLLDDLGIIALCRGRTWSMSVSATCGVSSTCRAIRRSFVPFAVPLCLMRANELSRRRLSVRPSSLRAPYRFRPRSSSCSRTRRSQLSMSKRLDATLVGELRGSGLGLSIGATITELRRQCEPETITGPSRWDRACFHRSGTRGRQGLGARPVRCTPKVQAT